MCRYILPLLPDTITPVQQGISVTACVKYKVIQAFKAKAKDHPQGQGLDASRPRTRILALRTKAKD